MNDTKSLLLLGFKTPKTSDYSYEEELQKSFSISQCAWDDVEIHDGVPRIANTELRHDFIIIGPVHEHEATYSTVVSWLNHNKRPFLSYGTPPSRNNKLLQTNKLSQDGIPQPRTIVGVAGKVDPAYLAATLSFPLVSKITNGAKGKGVEKHDNIEALTSRLERDAGTPLIFQEFIQNEGDYRVFFLKDQQLYAILRKSMSADEFRNNISLGGSYKEVQLPDVAKAIAAKAVTAMGYDVTGVDLINRKGTDDWYVLEVNAAPQFSLPQLVIPAMAEHAVRACAGDVKDEGPKAKVLIITAEPENFVPVELAKAAKEQGHEVTVIDERTLLLIEGGSTDITKNGRVAVVKDGKIQDVIVDENTVIIPRLNEHDLEFKLGVMNRLEKLGANLLNSAASMALCNDKLASQVTLNSAGFKTPWSFMLQKVDHVELAVDAFEEQDLLKFPAIIKTLRGTHGVGVMKLDSRGSFVSVAQALLKDGINFMGQEFCEHKQSIRIIMLGDQLLAANVRGQPENKDEFRTNSHLGSETQQHDPTEAELDLGRKIVQLFGCNFCAIDFIISDEGEVTVLEVNGSPGLEAIQKDWPEKDLAAEVVKYATRAIAQPEKQPGAPTDEVVPPEQTLANTTGTSATCLIPRLSPNELDVRVDTGASVCSIDARDVVIDEEREMVTFTHNDTRYRAPYHRIVKIKNNSGGDSDRRPTILLSVSVNGQDTQTIEFSLRDRSAMKYPVLLGRNAIAAFGLTVQHSSAETTDGKEEVEEVEEE